MTNPANDSQPKDQNVLSFMMQLVQQKHGDEIDANFLTQESDRLYDQFGDALVDYFEPILTNEQKQQFDSLIDNNAEQEQVLEFLMSSISELDVKIQEVLVQFRNKYLSE